DAFSSAVTFGNITMAHSMPSGGGIHSITSQWKSRVTSQWQSTDPVLDEVRLPFRFIPYDYHVFL
ncbi:hypothetical protein, partial [Novosphingobium profundi]|uniref:hypothetical protein n=1 Tax=Novosphingobium profundi TaxID=1774954 RepID=UPI001BD9175D